jgi:hypothetical protein
LLATAPGRSRGGDQLAGGSQAIADLFASRAQDAPRRRRWRANHPELLLHAIGACRFYLVQPVVVDGTSWRSTLYVNPDERGMYEAYVVVVGAADDERFHELAAAGGSPLIERLPKGARSVHVAVRCCA